MMNELDFYVSSVVVGGVGVFVLVGVPLAIHKQ
jgi:hypothetical protein